MTDIPRSYNPKAAAQPPGAQGDRQCCFLHPQPDGYAIRCAKPAEWELWPSTARYEFVDACTDHVGALLDDAPETHVLPISSTQT